MARPRAVLIINPSSDTSFVQHVQQLLAAGIDEAGQLEERLRHTYPRAVVRPRDLEWEQRVVWYVYRDGRWTPGAEAKDGS